MDNFKSQCPKIAIIGAGFSGICAAIQLEKQLGIKDYTIFDENSNFGGTWLVNTYPGCAVDITSHLYSYSFELNPDWTKNYCRQPEILDYIVKVAEKYKLYEKTKFLTQVTSLEWSQEEVKWKLFILNKSSETTQLLTFDYTIIAVGALRTPYTPPEFLNFTGPIIHSAQWDSSIDLSNKVVGVIGSGASAIQIVPSIAPIVKQLHSYQRQPAWLWHQVQFKFPTFLKKLFELVPLFMLILRFVYFILHELWGGIFKIDTISNKYFGATISRRHMERIVENEETRKKLLPNYTYGCKRVLFSQNYFQAFNRQNVILHRAKIQKVGADFITVDGVDQKLDVLILATGFYPQEMFAPLKIIGKDGVNLGDTWSKERPQTYFGIMTNHAPNAFFLLGPNTIVGHTSVIIMIECQVNFMLQILRQSMQRAAKGVQVKVGAVNKFMEDLDRDMKTTVWGTTQCGSWYQNSAGEITSLWPNNCIDYIRQTRKVDMAHMEFIYS